MRTKTGGVHAGNNIRNRKTGEYRHVWEKAGSIPEKRDVYVSEALVQNSSAIPYPQL
jgi:hypothetical protein